MIKVYDVQTMSAKYVEHNLINFSRTIVLTIMILCGK